jgi:hypothetical protein
MAASVPAGVLAIAGVHLDQVRGSDLYRSLPPAWVSALAPFREASVAWLAYNGNDFLVIAGGQFSSAPAGTILTAPGLSLAGSSAIVRAAQEQQATGRSGAPELVAEAVPVAGQPIWAVIRGDARLPLAGNLANFNRMLSFTRYATLAIRWDSATEIEMNGYCATPEIALRLEENLRGLATLAGATARAPDLRELLQSIRIEREASAVHVRFRANPSAFQELLR